MAKHEIRPIPYEREVYDGDGNLKLEHDKYNRWYTALTPSGEKIRVEKPKKVKAKETPQDKAKLVTQYRDTSVFKQPTEELSRSQKEAKKNEWRQSQRACLKRMMSMNAKELYSYWVYWGKLTSQECLVQYGYAPDDTDFLELEQTQPTMTQMVCAQMMMKAQEDGKFGMQILELIEGKSTTVDKIQQAKTKKKKAKSEDNQTLDALNETLSQLQSQIFD